jgi:hypothetical protein
VGWLGHGETMTAQMMWALSVGAYVHLLTGSVTAVLRGLSRTRSEMSYAVLWLALGVITMPLCGWRWGPVGVAVGSSLAQIGACVLLMKLAAAELKFDLKAWARNAFAPLAALLPLACVGAGCWSMLHLPENRLNAALFMGSAALGFFGATGIVYWNAFLTAAERATVQRIAAKFRAKFLSSGIKELTHVPAD